MATYYDVLSVPQDAPREEIERALERMSQRLKQTGQWEQYQDQFRKIENTLLSSDLRIQYDMQNRLRTALRPAASPPPTRPGTAKIPAVDASKVGRGKPLGRGPSRSRLLQVGVAVLVLGLGYGAWWLYGRFGQRVDEGIYLLNRATGEKAAVVLDRDEAHLFPGKSTPARGVLLYMIASKRAAWVGEGVVDIQFTEGDPAPEGLLKEGLEAAQTQDTHQTLR